MSIEMFSKNINGSTLLYDVYSKSIVYTLKLHEELMDGLSPEEIGYIFMGRTVLDCTPLFKLNARIGSTFCSVLKRTFIPAKIPAPFKLKKSEMEAAEVYEQLMAFSTIPTSNLPYVLHQARSCLPLLSLEYFEEKFDFMIKNVILKHFSLTSENLDVDFPLVGLLFAFVKRLHDSKVVKKFLRQEWIKEFVSNLINKTTLLLAEWKTKQELFTKEKRFILIWCMFVMIALQGYKWETLKEQHVIFLILSIKSDLCEENFTYIRDTIALISLLATHPIPPLNEKIIGKKCKWHFITLNPRRILFKIANLQLKRFFNSSSAAVPCSSISTSFPGTNPLAYASDSVIASSSELLPSCQLSASTFLQLIKSLLFLHQDFKNESEEDEDGNGEENENWWIRSLLYLCEHFVSLQNICDKMNFQMQSKRIDSDKIQIISNDCSIAEDSTMERKKIDCFNTSDFIGLKNIVEDFSERNKVLKSFADIETFNNALFEFAHFISLLLASNSAFIHCLINIPALVQTLLCFASGGVHYGMCTVLKNVIEEEEEQSRRERNAIAFEYLRIESIQSLSLCVENGSEEDVIQLLQMGIVSVACEGAIKSRYSHERQERNVFIELLGVIYNRACRDDEEVNNQLKLKKGYANRISPVWRCFINSCIEEGVEDILESYRDKILRLFSAHEYFQEIVSNLSNLLFSK